MTKSEGDCKPILVDVQGKIVLDIEARASWQVWRPAESKYDYKSEESRQKQIFPKDFGSYSLESGMPLQLYEWRRDLSHILRGSLWLLCWKRTGVRGEMKG